VAVGELVRRQVGALPRVMMTVTEHRAPARALPQVGATPARQAAPAGRGLCAQLYGSRISTGTVDATARIADPLQQDLLERMRNGRAVHMDETEWRTAGERRALWGIFDERHATEGREDHAKQLLADTKATRGLGPLVGL
jgi:hypothetical protein